MILEQQRGTMAVPKDNKVEEKRIKPNGKTHEDLTGKH